MRYCSHCLVEVDEGVETCPLCDAPIEDAGGRSLPDVEFPAARGAPKPRMSDRTRRNLTWEVISILCAIAVIVVAGSDLRGHSRIGWSIYPMSAIGLAWMVSTVAIYVRNLLVLSLASVLAAVVFLFVLAEAGGAIGWLFTLAFPLLACSVIVSGLAVFIVTRLKSYGLNVIALVSLALTVLAVSVDGVISRYLSGQIELSWSIIVLQALVPFSGIMLFLHYRLRNRFDFRRIFHL